MPSVQCPHCLAKLKVTEAALGKQGRCPKCQQTFLLQLPKAADEYDLASLEAPLPAISSPAAPAPSKPAAAVTSQPATIAASGRPFADEREMSHDSEKTEARDHVRAGFFMAVDAALLGSNSLYRVYLDGDSLVLLRVGSFFGPLGVEVGRQGPGGHWLGTVASAAKPVVIGAVVVGSIIGAILLRLIVRGRLPVGGALDLLLGFGLLGLYFGLVALWFIGTTLRRAAAVDAMTADERRAEAGRDRRNRVLTTGDIAEASLDKAAGGWGTDEVVPAKLTLALRPKGQRKLRLEDRRDVEAAARAIRRLIGTRNVTVSVPLNEKS